MLLTYVDESYDSERYWIAALVCPQDQAVPLTEALDEVVKKAAKAYSGISYNAELHGHALFHGQDDWASVATMPRARIGVYNDAFKAIGAHDVEVFIRGVHIPRLNNRYIYPDHPHGVVLQHLLERVDIRAEFKNDLAIIIADEVDGAALYRRNLWHFQRAPTPGYKARKLTRIVDTIHFAPSSASRLLQAADLIAYLYYRMHAVKDGHEIIRDDREARANTAIWARVQLRVLHNDCWWP